MGVYSNILNQAQGVAGTPYQGYGGELVAGINPQQMMGIGNINAAQPWFGRATQMAYNAAQPIGSEQIQQYMSPYVQNVVDATQRQFGNMNAQQQQQVIGNAAAQNALGGNRTGIAQSQLANQQQLAQAPVISGLYNQGYSQALNTALAEQQAGLQGAYGVGNLAQAQLSGANAQIGAGTLQQQTQQQQDIANYQQFMNERAYPFQTLQWLAGLGTGVGSQMGGTTYGQATTTAPPPSWLGQLAGGLLGGAALLGGTGAFGQGGYMNFGGGGQRTAARGGRINAPVGVAGYQAGGGVAAVPYSSAPQWGDPKWKPAGFVPGVDITRGQGPGYGGVHFVEPHKDTQQSGSPGMKDIMQATKAIKSGSKDTAAQDAADDAAADAADDAVVSDIGPAAQPIDVTTAAPTTTSSVVPSAAEVSSVVPEAATEAATSAGSLAEAGLGSSVGALADAGVGAGAGLTDAGLGAAGAGGDALAGLGAGIEGGGEALAGIGGEALAGLGAGASELFAGLGAESMAEVLPWLGMLLLNRGGRVNGVAGYQAGGGVADDERLLFDPKTISGEDARDLQRFERIGDPNDDAPPRSAESLQAATGVAPGSEYSPLSASSIAGSAPEGFRKVIPASEAPLPQPRPADAPAGVAPAVTASAVPVSTAPAGVVPAATPAVAAAPAAAPAQDRRSLDDILLRAGAVTKRQESGGNYGNDTVTWSDRRKTYQHALGAYGIMDEDLPRWSKAALGREVTPQEFLRSKEIQDAIYNHRMGMYIQKYGVEGAGRAWLGGEGGVDKPWRRDPLGTPIGAYGKNFVTQVSALMNTPAAALSAMFSRSAAPTTTDPGAPRDISAAGYAAAPTGVAPAAKRSSIDWGSDNPMWLPMAAAGFQMASAASRPGATFAGSMGEGGLTGLSMYQSQEALRQKTRLSEEDKRLRAQHLSDQAAKWQKDYELRSRAVTESERAHKEHESIQQDIANKPVAVQTTLGFRTALRDKTARYGWIWEDDGTPLGASDVKDGRPVNSSPAIAKSSKLPWWAQNAGPGTAQPFPSVAGGYQAGGAPTIDAGADPGAEDNAPPIQVADAGPALARTEPPVRAAAPEAPVRVAEAASPPPMTGAGVPFIPTDVADPLASANKAQQEPVDVDPARPFQNVTATAATMEKARAMGLTGQAMLDAIPHSIRRSVEAIANYKSDESAYSSSGRGGVQKSTIENLVRAVNPDYDSIWFAMQKQAMKNFYAATSPQSPLVLARTGKTAIGHAGELAEAIHDLHTADPANYVKNMGYINSAMQSALHSAREANIPFASWFAATGQRWITPGTKGPIADALARIAAAVPLYAGEVERFYTGAQGSETGRQQIQAPFDPRRSYQEHMAALHGQKDFFKSKTDPLNEEFETIMNAPGLKDYGTMKQHREWNTDNERSKAAQALIDKLYVEAKGDDKSAEEKPATAARPSWVQPGWKLYKGTWYKPGPNGQAIPVSPP